MTNQRLLNAPDLQITQEYGDCEGGKRLVAMTWSSKVLGISEREAVKQEQPAAAPSASVRKRRGEENARD